MARVAGLGAASALRVFRGAIGFEGDLGRRGGGAKRTLLGGPFLVAQFGFEPNDLFPQPVDDLLFLQTPGAVSESVQLGGG
jgi:hypothetical protein